MIQRLVNAIMAAVATIIGETPNQSRSPVKAMISCSRLTKTL